MAQPLQKTFVHPHKVYQVEYPAYWDQVTEKDGESCGFGPHERNDVGLWISILPMSVDTDRLVEDLPKVMQQALGKMGAENLRRDHSLRHYGLVADAVKAGEGGQFWIVAGGDVLLFASTQVPAAERDEWNPQFQRVMASLKIDRDDELLYRQVANEVLRRLRERHPEEQFEFDQQDHIRGQHQVVYLSNLVRDVRDAPRRRDELIQRFVSAIGHPASENIGSETWDEARGAIVPVLKHRDYVKTEGPTRHLLTSEWLADVVICYAIQSKKMFRFVTGWDVDRWGTSAGALHQIALENLARLPWPRELLGARTRDAGRVIVVDTTDSLGSSRLLHPDLHQLFSGPLGNPFWAGIPCRNRLVLFSDRRELKQRIGRKLRKDHDTSSYPITPRAFLVTRDGIAAPSGK